MGKGQEASGWKLSRVSQSFRLPSAGLIRLPTDSASENPEVDISDTLLRREWWVGKEVADSVRLGPGSVPGANLDSRRVWLTNRPPPCLSKVAWGVSPCECAKFIKPKCLGQSTFKTVATNFLSIRQFGARNLHLAR